MVHVRIHCIPNNKVRIRSKAGKKVPPSMQLSDTAKIWRVVSELSVVACMCVLQMRDDGRRNVLTLNLDRNGCQCSTV